MNGQYLYLTISINGVKVSGNHFNKPKYLDSRLGTAKARLGYLISPSMTYNHYRSVRIVDFLP
jgi:hypothetical protein